MVVRFNPTKAQQGWMSGLKTADMKGFVAAGFAEFSERDNPYRRYEHRRCWLEGFRRRRAMKDKPLGSLPKS